MPLRQIAVGLLLVAVVAGPAPVTGALHIVGWLLVIGAVQRLPRENGPGADGPGGLTGAAVVSLVVALPLAVPALAGRVADADPSIAWVLSLPQVLFLWLLARHLVALALGAGDADAASWWRWVRTGAVATAVLPALAFPTDNAAAIGATLLVGLLTVLLAVGLLVWHGSRPWARSERDVRTGRIVSPPDPSDGS